MRMRRKTLKFRRNPEKGWGTTVKELVTVSHTAGQSRSGEESKEVVFGPIY